MIRVKKQVFLDNDPWLGVFNKIEAVIKEAMPHVSTQADVINIDTESNLRYKGFDIYRDLSINSKLKLRLRYHKESYDYSEKSAYMEIQLYYMDDKINSYILTYSSSYNINTIFNTVWNFDIIYSSDENFFVNDIILSTANRNKVKKYITFSKLNTLGTIKAEGDTINMTDYVAQTGLNITSELYNNSVYVIQSTLLAKSGSGIAEYICNNLYTCNKSVESNEIYKDIDNNNYFGYGKWLLKL